jgi:Homeodomain-like domain-containing protein
MRPASDIARVRKLLATGRSDYEIARLTGIPRSTVQRWRALPPPSPDPSTACPSCGRERHRFDELPAYEYAYLLGQYLGDGNVWARRGGGHVLRISSDLAYPAIIEECCAAIARVRGRRPHVHEHAEKRMASILSYWHPWPCLLPQHGPGRKHSRRIALVDWQKEIVAAQTGAFLRGLIHSDGWRGLNRVRVKGRDYAYPRYQFSNRSDDIRRLFTDACDALGVRWRRWGRWHISVARRDSVALLDEFVGPKR